LAKAMQVLKQIWWTFFSELIFAFFWFSSKNYSPFVEPSRLLRNQRDLTNSLLNTKWKRKRTSQGQLLEMQLLESRLLDTFFRNLDCSTEKCHLLDRKKYAVRVPRVNFEQLIKKVHLLEYSRRWQNFCDSKK
jgi:hypothetical protein